MLSLRYPPGEARRKWTKHLGALTNDVAPLIAIDQHRRCINENHGHLGWYVASHEGEHAWSSEWQIGLAPRALSGLEPPGRAKRESGES